MTIEQRMDQLEKRNKRLTVALTMMAVVVCAVVTMAATGDKNGTFDIVTARAIFVTNKTGDLAVTVAATTDGSGMVQTKSAKGKETVWLGSTKDDNGTVSTYQPNGKALVSLISTDNGGFIDVYNKTGEFVAQMGADEYGNGVVGAYNRKGEGRTLQPGP
jgi:hypothetical protein